MHISDCDCSSKGTKCNMCTLSCSCSVRGYRRGGRWKAAATKDESEEEDEEEEEEEVEEEEDEPTPKVSSVVTSILVSFKTTQVF